MAFACIYIPDFLVQAVVRSDPALREHAVNQALATKTASASLAALPPLALISGSPPLWSVAAASPAALQAGIQVGMTKAQAAEFIGVQICSRSESQEKAAHAALLDVAWSVSPRVEDTAPDTIVLDLDGLVSLFGTYENITQELARRVSRIGLAPQIAVASNIEAAILAARGFPGVTIIPAGKESHQLSALPVTSLVTSNEILEILERWGVDTLQALAALPVLQLSERLGQEGVRQHELARGTCQRSLVLAQPTSSFEEEMELDDAVEELEPLSFLLGRLLDQLCARLEARALAVRAVHVRFTLAPSFEKNFQTLRKDIRKKPAPKSYTKVLSLPVPLRNSKTLLKLLRLQLQSDPPPAPIQKVSLRADSAAPRTAQNGLFRPSAPDPEKLELTLARLAKLVGESNLGSAELLDSRRPDHFRMTRFVAPGEGKKTRRQQVAAPNENGHSLTGFRVFRPSLPIKIEIRDKQPARVCLLGAYSQVVAVSGPWRSSGDWWQEDAWYQDEWDLALDFRSSRQHSPDQREQNKPSVAPDRGVYRIYYDALREAWFARGYYD
jgi:protein ImuB